MGGCGLGGFPGGIESGRGGLSFPLRLSPSGALRSLTSGCVGSVGLQTEVRVITYYIQCRHSRLHNPIITNTIDHHYNVLHCALIM